jgi:HEAT repeat protein
VTKRNWTVIVIIAVIIGGVYVWSAIAKSAKTQELLGTLPSGDDAKVLDAMQQLRQRGPSIGPRLVALLNSGPPASYRAASLLGTIGYKPAAQDLTAALRSPDPDTRGCAALALGQLKVAEAIPPLAALLSSDDEEPYVRVQVANALGLLKAKDNTVVKAMADILAACPPVPPEVPPGTPPKPVDPNAPKPPEDKTIKLRAAVARALGMIEDPGGVEAVRNSADSTLEPVAEVRVAAAYALADFGKAMAQDPEQAGVVVKGLLTALQDKNGDVRIAAAYGCGEFDIAANSRPDAEAALVKAVSDDDYWVRRAARRALKRMNVPVTVDEVQYG